MKSESEGRERINHDNPEGYALFSVGGHRQAMLALAQSNQDKEIGSLRGGDDKSCSLHAALRTILWIIHVSFLVLQIGQRVC